MALSHDCTSWATNSTAQRIARRSRCSGKQRTNARRSAAWCICEGGFVRRFVAASASRPGQTPTCSSQRAYVHQRIGPGLLDGTYKPGPVRRTSIPKPDGTAVCGRACTVVWGRGQRISRLPDFLVASTIAFAWLSSLQPFSFDEASLAQVRARNPTACFWQSDSIAGKDCQRLL